MRLSISAGLACFVILVLASSLPTVIAERPDEEARAFEQRVERMLTEHSVRLDQNDQFHNDVRETHIAERLARIEESQAMVTRLSYTILIAVLGLLLRDVASVLRRKQRE